uniref:Glycerol-3-phosphate acyltransferase 2, mitochondrial n=1 Tax=Podarcis muralis TaxID=64176 RepID=A0A670IRF1_PODMU
MKTLDLDSEWKPGTVVPFFGQCRPFVGYCCQRCTPKSWVRTRHTPPPSLSGALMPLFLHGAFALCPLWYIVYVCCCLGLLFFSCLQPDVPVVFLSTHKSQLDRLLLQLLLISQGLGTPRPCSCSSLYRTLLALLGGVFLPQGVEQARDSEQGVLSRAVLASVSLVFGLWKEGNILDCEKLEQWSPGSKGIIALNTEQEILGVFLSQLMQDFFWLTEEILLRSYDVGFSGQVRDVVMHALFLLRHCISLYELSLRDVLVVPKKTDEAMTELSQHSTALLPVFIQEAVGVCAANALLVELLPYLGSPEQLRDVVLAQEELHNKTVLLVQLLPRDFLLCQPCQSLYNYCQVAIDKLIQCGLLVAEEMPSDVLVCDTAQKRFTKRLLWKATDDFADSDSDYSDETGNCGKLRQLFVFLCCLLSPLLKTLERATVFLWEMESPQSGILAYNSLNFPWEGASKHLEKFCSVGGHLFYMQKAPPLTAGQGEPILHLSETFRAKENQEKLEKFIQQFIYS